MSLETAVKSAVVIPFHLSTVNIHNKLSSYQYKLSATMGTLVLVMIIFYLDLVFGYTFSAAMAYIGCIISLAKFCISYTILYIRDSGGRKTKQSSTRSNVHVF